MDETKSQAYLTWAEWGPAATIPRDQRLAECYPEISREELRVWRQEFEKIDGRISRTYEQFAANEYSDEGFATELRQEFPFLNDAAVQKALFLANYYWWHG